MNQVQNVVFDRAAGYYDQTRSLPPHEAAQLADALWQVLGVTAATHVLEIGIGTGRIAGPLVQRGLTMTGVDLSRSMLAVLRQKFPALPVALADMTRLPFAPGTFDGILAFHVLHLVSGWRDALAEAVRVLRPGGKFIYSIHHRDPSAINMQLRTQWRQLLAAQGTTAERPGTRNDEQVDEALHQLGCRDHAQVDVIRSSKPVTARRGVERHGKAHLVGHLAGGG
ncbi:MAG: methyltransferase domain-containing protein [Anaerolineae bacterium]|nr:methyltransferase domain-containing protein [Anaerolineae bacterium]